MTSISAAELQRQHLQSSGMGASASAAPAKAPMADPFPSLGGDDDPFPNGSSGRPAVAAAAEWGPLASTAESAGSKTNGQSAPAGPAPKKQQAQPDM
jgi:hypothetical protein